MQGPGSPESVDFTLYGNAPSEDRNGCSPNTDVHYTIIHHGCPSYLGASVPSVYAVRLAAATLWMNPGCAYILVFASRFGTQVVHTSWCLHADLVSFLPFALHLGR